MFNKKTIFRLLINSTIGVLLIIVWIRFVDLNAVMKEISKINFLQIVPFVAFFVLSNFLRSLRLKLLLANHKISLKNIVLITYLGQLLSFTIPLRIGEVAKGIYLSSEYGIKAPKAVVWIFMDRFLDFWLTLILALILLMFVPTSLPRNILPSLILSISFFSFGAGLLIFLPKKTEKLINLLSLLLIFNFLKKYFSKISYFLIDSASFLKIGFLKTILVLLVTVLALLSDGLSWFVVFLAVFGSVDFLKVLLGSFFSALTFLIPSAPGYVGSAEASGLAVFSFGMGLDKTLTSATVLIAHGMSLICILLFGLVSLYFLKFNLNLVWKKLKR